jgi:hypothetical protein
MTESSEDIILKKLHIAIAFLVVITGFALKFFAAYKISQFPQEPNLFWHVLEEFGNFAALIAGLHFLYEVFIRREEHNRFISNMKSEIKNSLDIFANDSIESLQQQIVDSKSIISQIQVLVEQYNSKLPKVKYFKVGDEETEATIYKKVAEIFKDRALSTVDIFTSYLLEVDSEDIEVQTARDAYFNSLIDHFKQPRSSVKYRRLLQSPEEEGEKFNIEKDLEKAKTYLNHIIEMDRLQKTPKTNVELRYIHKKRPTTYAIVDDKYLLWQINQIKKKGEMQMYGMFYIEDPSGVLIQYFREEFDEYWRNAEKINLHLLVN